MHGRILFGVVAWLLGAATATAGSLLAVSLLGQGITGTSGALLTQDAVDRALASASAESFATDDLPSPAASAVRSATRSPSPRAATDTPTPSAPASGTGATAPTPSASSTSPSPHDTTSSGDGTVLTSRGGDVVASCPAAGAYLDSWSPAQGYVADDVRRGPAPTARVTFESSSGSEVTMVVSCSGGIPSAHTSYDE